VKFNHARFPLTVVLALFLSPFTSRAQTPGPATKNDDIYKKIWKFPEWYKNDQNSVVQSVFLTGRFQYEYATVHSDQGNHSEWNIRRLRLGAKSKFFRTLTLHGEVELQPQGENPALRSHHGHVPGMEQEG
jgi:phosphate-selective porin